VKDIPKNNVFFTLHRPESGVLFEGLLGRFTISIKLAAILLTKLWGESLIRAKAVAKAASTHLKFR
jgi:hypothetical protein